MRLRPYANLRYILLRYVLLIVPMLLAGCASFNPGLKSPTVNIASLELLEAEGLSQRFRIGLLVTNANAVPLPVTGMSYTLSLNGFNLINGASNKIPTLEAYTETPVTIEASTDLFAALRLLSSLANTPGDTLDYQFDAKLDLEGMRPVLNMKREGQIDLRSEPN